MQLKKATYILLGALTALVVWLFFLMRGFPPADANMGWGPAFYPTLLLIALAVLIVVQFCRTIKMGDEKTTFTWQNSKKSGTFLGMMVLYALLLNVIGFILDGLLFLILSMKLLGAKWKWALIVSVIMVAFLFALFRYVFRVPLPMGMLMGG